MVSDPEQQTVRPRQIYTGDLDRSYIPISERG
jgi:citrate synthase